MFILDAHFYFHIKRIKYYSLLQLSILSQTFWQKAKFHHGYKTITHLLYTWTLGSCGNKTLYPKKPDWPNFSKRYTEIPTFNAKTEKNWTNYDKKTFETLAIKLFVFYHSSKITHKTKIGACLCSKGSKICLQNLKILLGLYFRHLRARIGPNFRFLKSLIYPMLKL